MGIQKVFEDRYRKLHTSHARQLVQIKAQGAGNSHLRQRSLLVMGSHYIFNALLVCLHLHFLVWLLGCILDFRCSVFGASFDECALRAMCRYFRVLLFQLVGPRQYIVASALSEGQQDPWKEQECVIYFIDLPISGQRFVFWLLREVLIQRQGLQNAIMPLEG